MESNDELIELSAALELRFQKLSGQLEKCMELLRFNARELSEIRQWLAKYPTPEQLGRVDQALASVSKSLSTMQPFLQQASVALDRQSRKR